MQFEEIINSIQLGDCYELIKTIPNKSIDLVIIDPPYQFCAGGYVWLSEKEVMNNEI